MPLPRAEHTPVPTWHPTDSTDSTDSTDAPTHRRTTDRNNQITRAR
ncbi:hypothetical protein [Streptomyces albipurpureus]|uniref:Uncharacterized protein n=1 Tax=Streptomyces albipurpureus TaxID=2897419 RepID=A0ABT0UPX2_9ACTN|nr:hypothetical protein [Streptomyces sp. CWNU-1]MCM2390509.1 hypothetical protein [Streptomyces sp. CWNU-1]